MVMPEVSILVPHFQTPDLTRLCLHLLRQSTGPECETLVIDNGSRDESREILSRLPGIRLLRRDVGVNEWPARSHGLALNFGVRHARADLVIVMHTDTMVLRPDWVAFLRDRLEQGGPHCGAVGSWKMEHRAGWQRLGKWLERWWRGKVQPPAGHYIRSHCALFRRRAIECRPAMFEPTLGHGAGEELHEAMQAVGQRCKFVPPSLLERYVRHLNHATMALNRQLGQEDRYMPRTRRRALRRIERFFQSIGAEQILAEELPAAGGMQRSA